MIFRLAVLVLFSTIFKLSIQQSTDSLDPPRDSHLYSNRSSSLGDGIKNFLQLKEQKNRFQDRKQLIADRVERFTAYHLYFQTSLRDKNTLQCFETDFKNHTLLEVESKIDTCSRVNYFPRNILRSHITWKPNTTSNSKKNTTSPDSSNSTDNQQNGTSSSNMDRNDTSRGEIPSQEFNKSSNSTSEKQTSERIHDYLVLALLIPNHPFSEELYSTLSTIGPMYPQITIITGHVYEFRDIAAKYMIFEFPTVLLFKNGIYQKHYHLRDPAKFAAQLGSWTRSYPRSIPAARRVVSSTDVKSHIILQAAPNLSWLQPILNHMPLPMPNLEPFIGSIPFHQELDIFVFLFASVYTISRGIFALYLWIFPRRVIREE